MPVKPKRPELMTAGWDAKRERTRSLNASSFAKSGRAYVLATLIRQLVKGHAKAKETSRGLVVSFDDERWNVDDIEAAPSDRRCARSLQSLLDILDRAEQEDRNDGIVFQV